MVVQIPLSLANWEMMESYGFAIAHQFRGEVYAEYTRITILTNSRKFRMAPYVANHEQISVQVFNAYLLIHPEGLLTNQLEREFVRGLMEAEGDTSYKSIPDRVTDAKGYGVLH